MDKNIAKFELAWNPLTMGEFPKEKLSKIDGVNVNLEQISCSLNQVITIQIDLTKHFNYYELIFVMGMFTGQNIK